MPTSITNQLVIKELLVQADEAAAMDPTGKHTALITNLANAVEALAHPLQAYAERIHQTAVEHGWWEADRNFGEMIALQHSELSEALEAWRKNDPNVYILDSGKPEGVAIEMLDCVIRILDTLNSLTLEHDGRRITIDEAIELKLAYNDTRPYRHGGKRA